jgi:1,4-alpha-glucan branching enzyme
MLERHPDPKTGKVKVTFRLPATAGATIAWVAGEWNDWSHLADQMDATADGMLECTVMLEPGRSYRFRYYLGNGRWENDWDADSYVDNEFGGADSVVTLDAIKASELSNGGRVEPPVARRIRVEDRR